MIIGVSTIVVFLVLLLVTMLQAAHTVPDINCNVDDPLPILHKYSQSRDLTIASIISQVYTFSSPIRFDRHPSSELQDEVM